MAVRLGVAPRFHLRADWGSRLEVTGGVEEVGGVLLPRRDWRALNAAETASVAAAGDAASAPVLLFNLPGHVRAAWWEAAEQVEAPGGGTAYERFVAGVVEFLQFKQMPLPPACAFDVQVSRPGLRSTRIDPATGAAGGLRPGAAIAWINLGDEVTHIALAEADGAVLRLGLESGEGVWFVGAGIAYDGDTIDKLDLDAVLTLTPRSFDT